MTLQNGRDLFLVMAARLIDPVSGKVLASNGASFKRYRVRTVRSADDYSKFAEDFTKQVNSFAKKTLKELRIFKK
jgi:hypothetical protein